jgi:hypothetical protein
MRLKLTWRRHPVYRENIIGICEELPDNFCNFSMAKCSEEQFQVSIPGLGSENISKRFVFKDADIAREFCEDYLNNNVKEIVRYQIDQMKRTSMNGIKPVSYYTQFISQ